MTSLTQTKPTPLYKEHIKLNARMAEFAGWQVPIQYTGIVAEHNHTRTKAGIFDICHMGEFIIWGADACADLENILACKISDMPIGKCRYGFMLNENGGVIDDLLVFRLDVTRFMLVVNAGTSKSDAGWIVEKLSQNTCFEDVSQKTAKIDLQGPLSAKVFEDIFEFSISNILYYSFLPIKVFGIDMIVSRTGYTGELGYELFFDSLYAVDIWKRLLEHESVKPAGFGARDTLRLELGYPLYGHDLTKDRSPIQAQLERFVCMDKNFIGREALGRQIETGDYPVLVGFVINSKRSAREGFSVFCDDKEIGIVTSASFSPSLGYCIGLAYVQPEYTEIGRALMIKSERTQLEAVVSELPFYKKGTVKNI